MGGFWLNVEGAGVRMGKGEELGTIDEKKIRPGSISDPLISSPPGSSQKTVHGAGLGIRTFAESGELMGWGGKREELGTIDEKFDMFCDIRMSKRPSA